nr:MAG TPA: hypothetical protein [Caudoviricetes sp.]
MIFTSLYYFPLSKFALFFFMFILYRSIAFEPSIRIKVFLLFFFC